MRKQKDDKGRVVAVWISASETDRWARRADNFWPGSILAGKRLRVEFDSAGNLVDLAINGREGECDAHELDAMLDDLVPEVRR